MKTTITALLATFISGVVIAKEPQPQTFLGITKDATRAEVTEKLECKFSGSNDHCVGSFYVPVSETRNDRIAVVVRFAGEKFASLGFETPASDAEKYFSMLLEKYGKPAKRTTAPVQNRMGATFTRTDMIWKLKGATIHAASMGNTITEAYFSFQSDEGIKLLEAKEQASRKNIF